MTRTKAQRQLGKIAAAAEWSQTRIAKTLDVDQSTVSLWISGQSRPEPPYRKAMQALWGIDEDDWLTADELAIVARAKQGAAKRGTGTDG